MIRTAIKILFAAAVIAALMMSGPTPTGTAQSLSRGPCICPQIYAPVICSNGRTYSNQCEADCAHAKDCVPTGGI